MSILLDITPYCPLSVQLTWRRSIDSKIDLYILSPVDLALSKVSRLERNDREDIAELARCKLIGVPELEQRASEAIGYYVGNVTFLQMNLKEAADLIRSV